MTTGAGLQLLKIMKHFPSYLLLRLWNIKITTYNAAQENKMLK